VFINVGSFWSPKLAFTYETLASSLKKHPSKGRNEEQKEMTRVPTKSPKWVTNGEGNKLCSKTPLVVKNISLRKERKPERIVSLEIFSL